MKLRNPFLASRHISPGPFAKEVIPTEPARSAAWYRRTFHQRASFPAPIFPLASCNNKRASLSRRVIKSPRGDTTSHGDHRTAYFANADVCWIAIRCNYSHGAIEKVIALKSKITAE
jgi:hypothetical protein